MNMISDFLEEIGNKSVHIIGVTGAEGSAILRFLRKHKISNITAHDFLSGNSIEKNYKLWHKGKSIDERNKDFRSFLSDLDAIKFYPDEKYLTDIDKAEIIFIPQSWRLYKQNNKLLDLKKKGIPFYSLTRLYLDLSPAIVIAVTGTVGKGSVVNILSHVLRSKGYKVYVAGNDTWMAQIADRLDEIKKHDLLILEVSHRQMMDGFTKAPHIAVLTNLYPNHLDEVSLDEYQKLKMTLFTGQKADDYAVINADIADIDRLNRNIISNKLYFSKNTQEKNIKSVQKLLLKKLDNKSNQYLDNILAAATVSSIFGIDGEYIWGMLSDISTLPARLQKIGEIKGINFFDDIKSTTPWATMAAVSRIGSNSIIICGGYTKGIDYSSFAKQMNQENIRIISLKSELGDKLDKLITPELFTIENNLEEAVNTAFFTSNPGDNIIISPAAAFFYSLFIKGRKSLKDVITSLPPKEQF